MAFKRYNEMEEAELVALEDEQIKRLVDYECALEGVPMLPPHPGQAPTKEIPETDSIVYGIGGVYTSDSEHAARILEVMVSGPLFKLENSRFDYNVHFLSPMVKGDYYSPKITNHDAHSVEQWDRISEQVNSFTARKNEYDAKLKEYNAAVSERKDIIDRVHAHISDARSRAFGRERLREEFKTYLELAEGDAHIAYNFLEKAKGHVLYDYPELKAEFVPILDGVA